MIGIIGRWYDKLKYLDGHIEIGQHGEFEWGRNQIQDRFSTLLAAWCRAESGYERIGYVDIGHGNVSWDSTPPTIPNSAGTLLDAYFRKVIPQVDIVFIDPSTDIPTGGTPSRKIEITFTLGTSEANGIMREFALFGGTATASVNSGDIVNYVVHSRIDKDTSLEIQRRIRFEFLLP